MDEKETIREKESNIKKEWMSSIKYSRIETENKK